VVLLLVVMEDGSVGPRGYESVPFSILRVSSLLEVVLRSDWRAEERARLLMAAYPTYERVARMARTMMTMRSSTMVKPRDA
jgi:hypothetical protein